MSTESIILFDDGIPTEAVSKYGKMIGNTLVVTPPEGSNIIGYRVTGYMPNNMTNIKIIGKNSYTMLSFE